MGKQNIITFSPTSEIAYFPPQPASKVLPEWYKESESYIGGKRQRTSESALNGLGVSTVKKCMPVFDALTAGYILFTQTDVAFSNEYNDDGTFRNKFWAYPQSDETFNPLSTHNANQLPKHPRLVEKLGGAAKFEQIFSIKTPPGYSCLFIHPVHREDLGFRIFEGVVDTDTYHGPVNFPFEFTDPDFEGVIPAGTPVAQVIPFKREEWEMEINKSVSDVHHEQKRKMNLSWWDGYKKNYWHKKSFR